MENEIKETALNGIDGFFTQLTEATAIVTEKLIDVAPEAAEHLLNLVQFKGVFSILADFIILGGLVALLVASAKLAEKGFEQNSGNIDKDCTYAAVGSITAITCACASIAIFVKLLNFYNWLSAFYPEGAIALKALEAVGITL